jgi:hypothetical protein
LVAPQEQVFHKGLFNSLVAVAGLALLATAGYWSVRLARADAFARENSEPGFAAAIRLAPQNAEYLVRLDDLREARGAPSPELLDAAVALNPNDAAAWVHRGLAAEMRQDLDRAEQDLLRAAEVSAQYEPRWTLANFYYRRQRAADFWKWARLALERSYGDRRPLFGLCWSMSQHPGVILAGALPAQPAVWRDYLGYLLAEKRIEAARPVAAHILANAVPLDLPVLLSAADHWIAVRSPGPALDVWNGLCARNLVPYPPLAPDRGAILTNGRFAAPFAAAGFDWRLPPATGLSAVHDSAMLGISFSGKQPESVEILWQYLPLEPALSYIADFEYRTDDIAPATGLRWKLFDLDGAEIAATSPQLSSPEWKQESISFAARGNSLARLSLCYQRPPGATRIEGSLWIRNMQTRFLP